MQRICYEDPTTFPPEGRYVLIRVERGTWIDRQDQEGVNYRVAKYLPHFCDSFDVEGEPIGPFGKWDEFGPDSYSKKEVTWWMPFPRINHP